MINLCTLNVNGMHNKEKAFRVIEFLKRIKCCIGFLQETHLDNELQNKLQKDTSFDIYSCHGSTSSRGVAILLDRLKINYELQSKFCDQDGRLLVLNIKIEESLFSLLCIYAPNSRTLRNTFFKKVNTFVKEKCTGILILGGDFNESLKNIDRKSSSNSKIVEPVNSLKTLIKVNKLADIWRVLNQNIQQFTWRRKDKSQASRIDYILISKDFQSFTQACKIKPAIIQATDHQSVCLVFQPGVSERGNGFWKLNNSILKDKEYQEMINNLLETYLVLRREIKKILTFGNCGIF